MTDKVELDRLISVEDAAKYFDVKVATFRKWLQRNKLPKGMVLKIGNTMRVRSEVLNKFISGELQNA